MLYIECVFPPAEMNEAHIILLNKPGPQKTTNKRCIRIKKIISKNYDSLNAKREEEVINISTPISQLGFTKGYSCADLL